MESTARSIPPEAITALESGNKVEAIKYVRTGNSLSLKEAKDFIETYLEKTPAGPEANIHHSDKKRIKISDTGWLVIAVVVVGVYYFIAGQF